MDVTQARTITVELGGRSYNVEIGKGLLGDIAARAEKQLARYTQDRKVPVIADTHARQYHGEQLERSLASAGYEIAWYDVASGEASKSWASLEHLTNWMLAQGIERSDHVFALGGAMLLAMTLIPVLAAFTLKAGRGDEAFIMRVLGPAFEWSLGRALKAPIIIYVITALGVGLAAISYLSAGKIFMPTMNEGAVVMQLASLPSINLDQSQADDLRIEAALIERVPEVRHVIARVGSDELGLDPMSLNESDAFLQLAPREGHPVVRR